MSAPETKSREAALAEFNRKRDEYEHSYDSVPDEALSYVPQGEDYTLGGLAVHVTDTLYHYRNVLDVMKGAGTEPVRNVDPEDDAKRRRDELVHKGFGGSEKQRVFEEMRAAHRDVEQRVRAKPEAEDPRESGGAYGSGGQGP